jgi:mRNA interferase MazF
MIEEGQIALFPFPQTDLKEGKLRPALIIRQCPTRFEDWLICMISSQIAQYVAMMDDIIDTEAQDFTQTGLKTTSVIRLTRLAVVNQGILVGSIGQISEERLVKLKRRLAQWLIS